MFKKLQNKKAEGYIDVAVAVLVIVFLLVFSVGIFSKIAVKQDLSHMCSELVEVATTSGRIGPEVQARYEQLCEEAGIRPTMTFTATYFDSSSGKVQLGDVITCKLTYSTELIGFGGFSLPFDVEVSESGLSRIYWK